VRGVRGQIAAVVGLLVVALVVFVVGGDSTAAKAVAFALFGIACVVAVALVFLAIGRSEDAEREASKPKPPEPHEGEAARRSRPRPPRRPT
jgi:uncharacterized membrane protein YuzA (DUF378 family)